GAGALGLSAGAGLRLGAAPLAEPGRRLDFLRGPLVRQRAAAGAGAVSAAAAVDDRRGDRPASAAAHGRVPAPDAIRRRDLDPRLLALERRALRLGGGPVVGEPALVLLGAAPLGAQPGRALPGRARTLAPLVSRPGRGAPPRT